MTLASSLTVLTALTVSTVKSTISCSFSPLSCDARIVCGTDSLAETRTKSESRVGILRKRILSFFSDFLS